MLSINENSRVAPDLNRATGAKPDKAGFRSALTATFLAPFRWLGQRLRAVMPRQLFARSLIIIVTPVVITQGVVTYIFFERHWDTVTRRLSESVAGDISLLIEIYETYPGMTNIEQLSELTLRTTNLNIALLKDTSIPRQLSPSFFSVLDRTLRHELDRKLDKPYWFDTNNYPRFVDIRVQLGNNVLRVLAVRERVFASSGLIFLLWMIGTSLVILTVAIAFLRNQVRPIQQLASAASSFGKGRDVADFKPTGATEVRRAAEAFIEMRERIKLQMEQRTLLLAGVSHDLKTPITRMKLQTAMLQQPKEVEALQRDLVEMEHMLEEYLAFARGQGSEAPTAVDLSTLLRDMVNQLRPVGQDIGLQCSGDLIVSVRRNAIKRCISNLIDNAIQFGSKVAISAHRHEAIIEVRVDDDGPGIPADKVEDAFKPFSRLDESRNLDSGGVGLGLAIAQDVARSHGGKIELLRSPWNGLRAVLILPV